jgi:nicotinamidase-related amidase
MNAEKLPRSHRALLLVDFINPLDFPGAEDLTPGALQAAEATLKLRRKLEAEGIPVIYANDNFGSWRSDFNSLVRQLRAGEGPARQLADMLQPAPDDLTVLKPRHSAFFGSPLEILLDLMGVNELVITGLATDICVKMTAMDAFLRDYRIQVPANCTAAESPQRQDEALAYMRDILRCDISPMA